MWVGGGGGEARTTAGVDVDAVDEVEAEVQDEVLGRGGGQGLCIRRRAGNKIDDNSIGEKLPFDLHKGVRRHRGYNGEGGG